MIAIPCVKRCVLSYKCSWIGSIALTTICHHWYPNIRSTTQIVSKQIFNSSQNQWWRKDSFVIVAVKPSHKPCFGFSIEKTRHLCNGIHYTAGIHISVGGLLAKQHLLDCDGCAAKRKEDVTKIARDWMTFLSGLFVMMLQTQQIINAGYT